MPKSKSNWLVLPAEMIENYPWVENYTNLSQAPLSPSIQPENLVLRFDGVEVTSSLELPTDLKVGLLEILHRDGDRDEIGLLKYRDEIYINRLPDSLNPQFFTAPD
jgi:hypothetical protein